jgi:hypothetical protein
VYINHQFLQDIEGYNYYVIFLIFQAMGSISVTVVSYKITAISSEAPPGIVMILGRSGDLLEAWLSEGVKHLSIETIL